MISILSTLKKSFLNIFLRSWNKIVFPFYSKKIIIARFDGLGDYILFRNFFEIIVKSDRFSGYKITFIGNKQIKDLAEHFDSRYIHEFIWIDPDILIHNNTIKKFIISVKLKFRCFDYLINPVHSRFFIVDSFLSTLGAKKKIVSLGDTNHFKNQEEYVLANSYYTEKIHVLSETNFEFYRNLDFINKICKIDLNDLKLKFDIIKKKNSKNKNIIIVAGATASNRRWSTNNFSELINCLSDKLKDENLTFLFTGVDSESSIISKIINNLKPDVRYKNLVNKIKLDQLVNLIASADLIISNETSTVHIAASVDTHCICISNGNHFGRFNPYPSSLSKKIVTFYPDNKFYNYNMKSELIAACRLYSLFDINKISPSQIINRAIQLLLNS